MRLHGRRTQRAWWLLVGVLLVGTGVGGWTPVWAEEVPSLEETLKWIGQQWQFKGGGIKTIRLPTPMWSGGVHRVMSHSRIKNVL